MNVRFGFAGQWVRFNLGEIFGEGRDCGPDGVGVEVEVSDQSQ